MKVLFIGGTGTISSAVSETAIRKGIDLYLLNRGNRNDFIPEGATLLKGDIRDEECVAQILSNHKFDVVVDWIAFEPKHIETDIHLFAGKVGQYIFISSSSVYQKPPHHYIVTESTPLYNPYYQYPQDKIACEEYLMQEYRRRHFPVTIVRPSYTYHRTIPYIFNSRKHPWTLIDRIRTGKKIIVPGDGTSLWTLTHAADLAKGFVGLLGNEKAIGHAFHITSDEVLTWDQIARCMGKAAGAEPDILHVTSEFIGAFSKDHDGSLLGDKAVSLVFDNSKIKQFVPGYSATIPFAEGIQKSIQWFEENPALCTVDDEFNRLTDRIIAAYEKGLAMANS